MRAALLPTPGDPYHVAYWLRHCERVWRSEVDELRVLVSGQPNAEARAAIRARVLALGGVYDERPHLTPHGVALGILVQDTSADLVVLLEDDAFVRRLGAVRFAFERIEAGECDVVASPRQSMSPELAAAAFAKWGGCRARDGAAGHGMWPAFVFARRADLLATDRNFCNWSWGQGQTVPGLDYVVPPGAPPLVTDTLGSLAFQLRSRLNVYNEAQFKGPWGWQEWLDGGASIPWFHAGSLSSSGDLISEEPVFCDGRTMTSEQELGEWSHRIHWWSRFLRHCGHVLPELVPRYRENLERLARRVGVTEPRISDWGRVVDRLITWDERP